MILYTVGWIVLMLAFGITGTRWFDLHQQTHNQWRPRTTSWLIFYSADEVRRIWRAQWHRDLDPQVERRRRTWLIVLAFAVAYMVVGFPLAVWLLA